MRHHIQPLHLVLALLVAAAGACGSSSEGLRQERRADVVYLLGGPAGGSLRARLTAVDAGETRIIWQTATGYDPEIAVSPDSSHLYVHDFGTDAQSQGDLTRLDADDGRPLVTVASPERIGNKGVGRYGMVASPDGDRLYVHKWKLVSGRHQGPGGYSAPASDHWWDIYDGSTLALTGSTPHVPDCGIAQYFPGREGSSQFAVACSERNVLVFIDRDSGNTLSTIDPVPVQKAGAGCIGDTELAAAAETAGGGKILIATRGGCVLTANATDMRVETSLSVALPNGWRVPFGMLALTRMGDRVFVGLGSGSSSDDCHEVGVFNTENGTALGTIDAGESINAIGVSIDGRLLYAASKAADNLLVIDIASGQRIGAVEHLGTHPEHLLVAAGPSEP